MQKVTYVKQHTLFGVWLLLFALTTGDHHHEDTGTGSYSEWVENSDQTAKKINPPSNQLYQNITNILKNPYALEILKIVEPRLYKQLPDILFHLSSSKVLPPPKAAQGVTGPRHDNDASRKDFKENADQANALMIPLDKLRSVSDQNLGRLYFLNEMENNAFQQEDPYSSEEYDYEEEDLNLSGSQWSRPIENNWNAGTSISNPNIFPQNHFRHLSTANHGQQKFIGGYNFGDKYSWDGRVQSSHGNHNVNYNFSKNPTGWSQAGYEDDEEESEDDTWMSKLLDFKLLKAPKLPSFGKMFSKIKLFSLVLFAFKLGLLVSPVSIPILTALMIFGLFLNFVPLVLIIILLFKILKKQKLSFRSTRNDLGDRELLIAELTEQLNKSQQKFHALQSNNTKLEMMSNDDSILDDLNTTFSSIL